MKKISILCLVVTLVLTTGTQRAAALSCLPTDIYLKDIVGTEYIVIFEATAIERWEEPNQTVEALQVTKALQGWVEEELLVYHEKHPDWGYLCNQGPKAEGSTGVYVATRNSHGQYMVNQRLDLTDPLRIGLTADVAAAEVEGGISEISADDRMRQIITSIQEILAQIAQLLREYSYWKNK